MKDFKDPEIRKYWQIINGRKYLFIGVSLLVMSIIVWGSYFMPKMYKGSSTVFIIESNMIKNLVRGMVVTPSINRRLKKMQYAMHSRELLMKVVRALDLDTTVESPAELEKMIDDFRKYTDVTVKGSDLFMVSYTGKDPKLVRDYINTLISIYVEEDTGTKREDASSANQFLDEQIAHYKLKYDEAEEKLARFRIEKDLYYAADEQQTIEGIKDLTDVLNSARMMISELEAKKLTIERQLSGESPLTMEIVSEETDEKRSLTSRIKNLETALPMMLSTMTENHPDVISVRAEIEDIKKQIDKLDQEAFMQEMGLDNRGSNLSSLDPIFQKLKGDILTIEADIDSLKAKERTILSRIEKFQSDLKDMPVDKKVLAGLVRERNSFQSIYEQLLSKLGKAEVSTQMELENKGTSFRIVDPAIIPIKPVSPDRVKFIIFGIAGGLIAGLGLVVFFEYLDHSIKDVDSLKEQFGLPVIGIIPNITNDQEIARTKKIDRAVYAASLAYLAVIGGLFMKEITGKFL